MEDENKYEYESRRKRREQSGKRSQNKSEKKNSPLVGAVIVIMLLVGATIVFLNKDSLSPENIDDNVGFADSAKKNAMADIAGSSVSEQNFCAQDSGLIYISDTSIVELNHNCERTFFEKHTFTNPHINSSGDYAIAFGEGGSGYRIIHDKHKLYEGTQGNSIIDGDINDSGMYCIISDKTGFLSSVSVYDKNNKFVYSYSFSDFYAVCASINRDGDKIAVGTVNSIDGRFVSKVYLLDVMKSDPIGVFTYQDQLIFDVEFMPGGNAAVITDVMASVIRSDGSKELPYSYSSQILTAYDINKGNIVLSMSKSDDGRDCSVVTLDNEGHEIGSFSTDLKITSVSAASDRFAVLSDGNLIIHSIEGDVLDSQEIGLDAKSVLLPQNKTAYVLCVSGIKKVTL